MSSIPTLIRGQEYFKGVLQLLEEEGIEDYEFQPPGGRGHYMLRMDVDGVETRVPVPGTPSPHGEAKFYVVSNVRRAIRRTRSILEAAAKKVDNPDDPAYK